MMTDTRLLDQGTMIRAAAARRPVTTSMGPAVLIRWDAPNKRGRARVQFSGTHLRTIKCADVLMVDLDAD
jgi:hypothetical protein